METTTTSATLTYVATKDDSGHLIYFGPFDGYDQAGAFCDNEVKPSIDHEPRIVRRNDTPSPLYRP